MVSTSCDTKIMIPKGIGYPENVNLYSMTVRIHKGHRSREALTMGILLVEQLEKHQSIPSMSYPPKSGCISGTAYFHCVNPCVTRVGKLAARVHRSYIEIEKVARHQSASMKNLDSGSASTLLCHSHVGKN
jgi:hypothetical protein